MGIEPRNVTTSNIVEMRAMFVCSVVHTLAASLIRCVMRGEMLRVAVLSCIARALVLKSRS